MPPVRPETKQSSFRLCKVRVRPFDCWLSSSFAPIQLEAAVGEAAYMTGLERNADIVIAASYAPLLGVC